VVVVDDQDRENEGDLVMAAEAATSEKIAFFLAHTSGVICAPLLPERADLLDLPLMVSANTEAQRTAFTVSVDYRHGTTTGISAADRAATIAALIDPNTRPNDLNRPGHIFPLRYRPGGVLKRAGHTEATVDLSRAAGLVPAGVLCEIVSEDKSEMARLPDLERFAKKHDLPLISIADLIRYRRQNEKLVRLVSEARIPAKGRDFRALVYESVLDNEQHLALVMGDVAGTEDVLVRVHSECLTGDVFHSLRCDCGEQLDAAFQAIAGEGRGVLLYMAQEGRGIGLLNKLKAYELQEHGLDTVDANLALGFAADEREWGIGNQILADLGLSTIRLLTNNPKKVSGLEAYGLTVTEQVPIEVPPNAENLRYLAAKRDKLGHRLHHQDLKFEPEDE